MGKSKKNSLNQPPLEVDFHGHRTEEVYRKLTTLVDRHEGRRGFQIRVIHGKGAGILATEVERFARNDPRVSSAEKDFFNPGITTLILNGKSGSKATPTASRGWDHIQAPRIRKRKG